MCPARNLVASARPLANRETLANVPLGNLDLMDVESVVGEVDYTTLACIERQIATQRYGETLAIDLERNRAVVVGV